MLEQQLLRYEEGFWTAEGRAPSSASTSPATRRVIRGIMDEEAVIDSIDDVPPWTGRSTT